MSCDTLSKNLLADYCAKAPVGGSKDALYLININDLDRTASTISATNDQLITAIVAQATKHGYKLTGKVYLGGGQADLVKGANFDLYNHQLPFKILEDSVEADKWADTLKNGRYVAILEKNVAAGNEANAFMVYGWDCGLEVTAYSSNIDDADLKGVPSLTLGSNEKSYEPRPPRRYLSTDYTTTKAALEALLPTP